MKAKFAHYLHFILVLVLISSCDTTPYDYKETNTITNAQWRYQEDQVFEFMIADTTKMYDLELVVKHHPQEYPYQNIYYKIITKQPSKEYSQVISSELAAKNGQWFGDCSSSSCTANISLQNNFRFKEMGKYRFTFQQFSRDSILYGVQSLSLQLRSRVASKE